MEKNTKLSLVIVSLIFSCILITFFIQKYRVNVDDPILILILGSAPSFFYTLGVLLICVLVVQKEPEKNCFFVFIGSLIYELSQVIGVDRRTFDYVDISFIVMAFILFTLLIKKSGYLLNLKESATKKAED
ncbi:MAG: hypothetical protein ACPGTQ_14900 [Colwellia sp.]